MKRIEDSMKQETIISPLTDITIASNTVSHFFHFKI